MMKKNMSRLMALVTAMAVAICPVCALAQETPSNGFKHPPVQSRPITPDDLQDEATPEVTATPEATPRRKQRPSRKRRRT